MNRQMAASLDHWLTTQPEEPDILVPGDEGYPRCSGCGGFLRREPDRTEEKSKDGTCPGTDPEGAYDTDCSLYATVHGKHTEPMYWWSELYRTCRRCGQENVEVQS